MTPESTDNASNPSEDITLFDDPIVAEVRQARMEILGSHGSDLEAMLRDVMKRQYESGREIVKAKPRGVPTPHNPE